MHNYTQIENLDKKHHIGWFDQIWDKRLIIACNFFYANLPQNYWYQWKGNLSRIYFSTDKKYIFIIYPFKIRGKLLILGFFMYFSNRCNFFLANTRCNSSMSFWSLDYCLKESLWQKIDFSLEAPRTVNLIFNLLSMMRHCVKRLLDPQVSSNYSP